MSVFSGEILIFRVSSIRTEPEHRQNRRSSGVGWREVLPICWAADHGQTWTSAADRGQKISAKVLLWKERTYLSQNILDLVQLHGVSRTHKNNPTAQIINKLLTKPSFQKQEKKQPSEQKFPE